MTNAAIAIVRCDGRSNNYLPEANRNHSARVQDACDAVQLVPNP